MGRLAALGEGSHGSNPDGNYVPTRVSFARKSTHRRVRGVSGPGRGQSHGVWPQRRRCAPVVLPRRRWRRSAPMWRSSTLTTPVLEDVGKTPNSALCLDPAPRTGLENNCTLGIKSPERRYIHPSVHLCNEDAGQTPPPPYCPNWLLRCLSRQVMKRPPPTRLAPIGDIYASFSFQTPNSEATGLPCVAKDLGSEEGSVSDRSQKDSLRLKNSHCQ